MSLPTLVTYIAASHSRIVRKIDIARMTLTLLYMPEGPECHSSAAKLEKALKGKSLEGFTVHGGRYATHGHPEEMEAFNRDCLGQELRVTSVGARGKLIVIFTNTDWCILNTLGLTGTWTSTKTKHCDVSLGYEGKTLWFKDQLHYGTIKPVNRDTAIKKIRSLGPDVTVCDPAATEEWWLTLCGKYPTWNICRLLMDQAKVSGIGNYLKAEILYEAGVAPTSVVGRIPIEKLQDIHRQMMIVPSWHFKAKLKERPRRFLKVYNRKKDPEGSPIEKCKTGDGRTSHWVRDKQIEYLEDTG